MIIKRLPIYVISAILIFTVLLGVGCKDSEEDKYTWFDKYYELEEIPKYADVWLEPEEVVYPKGIDKLFIKWHNESQSDLIFGKSFTVAKKFNGEWIELDYVNEELVFDSIGILLDKSNVITETYNLNLFNDELIEGQYLFVSSIMKDNIEYRIETEFEIN